MSVENSMKLCDGIMKQCVVGQNIPVPNCGNTIWSMRQRGDGKLVECKSCERKSNRNTRISIHYCFFLCVCEICFSCQSRAAPEDK